MITVFTPTYNRKNLLKRLYNSLKSQTDKNFEWLIIDDGSTDKTKEYIDSIKKESIIDIKYVYKENGGKPSAHNKAVEICKNDFILILDSDDYLTEDAICILNEKIKLIDNDIQVCGIIGKRGYKNKDGKIVLIGSEMPKIMYSTGLELYQKKNLSGDTLRLYKTNVLKKYLFPIIENEKFIPENVIFDKIDQEYKMLVIQEILYICEYQNDGLSNNINNIRKKNPIGYSLSLKSSAETALTLEKKIGITCLYIMWCKKFNINSYKDYKNKLVYFLSYPVAVVLNFIKKPKFYFNIFKEKNR